MNDMPQNDEAADYRYAARTPEGELPWRAGTEYLRLCCRIDAVSVVT